MAVLILIVFCIQPTNELRGGGVWFTIGQNNRLLNCLIHFTNDKLEHAVKSQNLRYVLNVRMNFKSMSWAKSHRKSNNMYAYVKSGDRWVKVSTA